jgi:hypothetical protein
MILPSLKAKSQLQKHDIREGVFSNFGHAPHMDWVLILILGVLITGALVTAGFYSYVHVGSVLTSSVSQGTSTAAVSIDPAMIDHVLKQYEDRAKERSALMKSYAGPTDPSL